MLPKLKIVIGLLLSACAAALSWMFWGEPAGNGLVGNSNVVGGIAGLSSVALAVVLIWPKPHNRITQPDPNALEAAASHLATETLRAWREEAKRRRITTPSPARVRWAWAGPDLASRSDEIDLSYRYDDAELLTAGVITQLHEELYLPLGDAGSRIVILGGPGAGKTTAMLLLLIDVLANRARGADSTVPVWLNLGGWNPETPFLDWAASTLARDYPSLTAEEYGGPSVPTKLIRSGKISLFLDGLDEMSASTRNAALEVVERDTTELRVVLTSRPSEYAETIRTNPLWDCAVIQVLPISIKRASEFLLHQQFGHRRQEWRQVADYMRARPNSVVARTLTTPLWLSLARDTFNYSEASPISMLDATTYPTADDLQRNLLTRLFLIAYPDDADRAFAAKWLTWIANRLDGHHDIRWWEIPAWMAGTRQRLKVVLRIAVVVGISALTGLLLSLIGGFAGLALGLQLGLIMGAIINIVGGPETGGEPQRFNIYWPKAKSLTGAAIIGLAVTSVCGLIVGILAGFLTDFATGLAAGLSAGLAAGLIAAFAVVLANLLEFWCKPLTTTSAVTPRQTYGSDLTRACMLGPLFGLAGGLSCGLAGVVIVGLLSGVRDGLLVGLVTSLVIGSIAGLAVTLGAGPTVASAPARDLKIMEVTWRLRGRRVRFIPMLEKALEKQILRQSGAIYQFRHSALQDLLRDGTRIP